MAEITDGTEAVASPGALLVAAADRIRDLAAAATPGPWQACEPWIAGQYHPAYVQTVTTAGYPNVDVAGWAIETEEDGMHGGLAIGDAAWVAALSPAVSPAIEALLRQAAHTYMLHEMEIVPVGKIEESALALARVLVPTGEDPR